MLLLYTKIGDFLLSEQFIILLLVIFILGFIATFLTKFSLIRNLVPSNIKLKTDLLRLYIFSLIILLIITLFYMLISRQFTFIPDPVVPYVFYILVLSILFDFKTVVPTALISIILIVFYNHLSRFDVNSPTFNLAVVITIISLSASIALGSIIRSFQKRILKEKEDLELLIRARDQFTSVTAHELKVPLTTIKLYSQLIEKKYKGAIDVSKLRNSARSINEETDKLLNMINDLLDFSKIQHNKLKLNPELFNLVLSLREIIKVIHSIYPDHNFVFFSTLRQAVVYADKLSIDRVLTNLLVNSAKYSNPGTKVIIKLIKKKDYFIASVKDQGIGIDEKIHSKIFNPFYQIKGGGQGLGLGLYITKTHIKLNKGDIWFESKVKKGSTFYISLPAAKNEKVKKSILSV